MMISANQRRVYEYFKELFRTKREYPIIPESDWTIYHYEMFVNLLFDGTVVADIEYGFMWESSDCYVAFIEEDPSDTEFTDSEFSDSEFEDYSDSDK